MKCLVAALVRDFTFDEVIPGKTVEKESVLTYRPKGGLHLRIGKANRIM
jgi:hypothetical protein